MLVPVVRRTTYPRIRCPAGQFFGGDKLSYYTGTGTLVNYFREPVLLGNANVLVSI